jgi:tetratricopeptide (TPR) repeat protein
MKQRDTIIKAVRAANDKLLKALERVTGIGRSKAKDPYNLHSQAIELHNQERYDEALSLYDRTLELRPADIAVMHNRGLLLHTLGRYDEALADFSRVKALRERYEPDHPRTSNYRGTFYDFAGRYEDALAEFNHTLLLHKDNVEALYMRARAFYQLGFLEDALDDLNRVEILTPGKLHILGVRATTHYNLGHYEEAVTDYRRICELYPGNGGNLTRQYYMARALQNLGRFEEAVGTLDSLLEMQPENVDYREARAYNLSKLRRFEDALVDYTWTIENSSAPDALLHYNRGVVYRRLERYEEAIEEYRKSLELKPDELPAQTNLASALYILGRLEEARNVCDAALLTEPGNIHALSIRAIARGRLNQLDEGNLDLAKAVESDPDGPPVRYVSAALLSIAGDVQGAMAILSELVSDVPEVTRELSRDPAFANLHELPAWEALLQERPET